MKRLLAILILATVGLHATVRNVPGTYSTIQSALGACVTGDTVLVQPGTYNENITWPSVNSIKLLSAGDSSNTIIYGNNSGRTITINGGVDTSTIIRGFAITGGNYVTTYGYGAGVYVSGGSVKMDAVCIRNNRVFSQGGWGYGGGVHLNNSSTVIINSTIRNNNIDTATWVYGTGIYITGGSPQLRYVDIRSNRGKAEIWNYGVGIYAINATNLKITHVKVVGNTSGNNPSYLYGTGMYINDCTASITNTLVASNVSGTGGNFNYGGGIYIDGNAGIVSMMNVTVTDNRKSGNASINGTGLFVRNAQVTVTNSILYNTNSGTEVGLSNGTLNITYSDVWQGYSGTGNIIAVPSFVSATDFHLTASSPCAGAGTPSGAPSNDLDNNPRPMPIATNPDMGCYEVSQLVGLVSCCFSSGVSTYPNPTSGKFRIETRCHNETVHYVLMDATGKHLFSGQLTEGNVEIDLGSYPRGLYFVKYFTINYSGTEKVIRH